MAAVRSFRSLPSFQGVPLYEQQGQKILHHPRAGLMQVKILGYFKSSNSVPQVDKVCDDHKGKTESIGQIGSPISEVLRI